MLSRLRSFLHASFRRDRFERGMADELRFHIETHADELIRAGVSRPEALRRARAAFGGVEGIKDECRQSRGLRLISELRQDLRYGVRMMAKTPVFTVAAILSLALGIGANTAIFSLIDAVLIRTLPVEKPEQLVFLAHDPGPKVSTSSNYPLFERYRTASGFSGVTAYRTRTFRVETPDGVERVAGQYVSGNYHAVVRPPMAIGRGFISEPDRTPGAALSAVISYEYWTTRFTRDAGVIGKTLNIDGRSIAIGGVTAPGFRGFESGGRADLTLPMSVMALDTPQFFDAYDGWVGLRIVGRLADGVAEAETLAAVEPIFQQFVEEPHSRWVRRVNRDEFGSAALLPAAQGTSGLRSQYSRPLWISMAMVAVVLLIACANIANLLLARAAARSREIAVRLSIGAGRFRLVRQLVTESLLLACCGGAAGVIVAIWGTDAILSVLSAGPSPVQVNASVNVRVLAFTAAVVVLTGVAFGLVPAVRSTRLDVAPTLKDGAGSVHGAHRPALGRALVVGQVALCVTIVAAAGLLTRSLANLHGFDAGFDRENILLADVDTSAPGIPPAGRMPIYSAVVDRLHALPGVRSVSLSLRSPIDFSSQLRRIDIAGVPPVQGQGVSSNVVSPEYFQTFGINLIHGRGFNAHDTEGAQRVAVVSESMARFYFRDANPIGHSLKLGGDKESKMIVGVVEDARHERLRVDAPPKMVYTPFAQSATSFDGTLAAQSQVTLAMRTSVEPASLAVPMRNELRAASKDVMVPYVRTMEQQVDATLLPERLLATLSTWFAVVALLLACVGLYGVMAYNVTRRTREIGIRIALGAVPRTVLYRVLRESLAVSAAGVVAGLLVAFGTTRALSTFLFGLAPHDPATLMGTAALLLLVALLAGFVPARHAASVDPVKALKYE